MGEFGVCGIWGTRLRRTQDLREEPHRVETKTPGLVAAGAFALAVALAVPACDRGKEPQTTEVVASALNASPRLGDFVLEAQNSIRLQTGGLVVNGGDIGARGTGSGPFLSGGVAIDAFTGVQIQTTHNLIADSVRLGTGARAGDIQTNRFVDGVGATHGNVSGMVPLPAVPAACGASPGTTNLTVGTGATVTASPGPFAAVSVGTGGKLRLNSGRYDMTNLTVGTGARIEALGPVQIRVANRLSTSSGSFIGAASGATLSARDLRIEISGQNGTSGALGATPPAASLGTGNVVTALILVPNGTLVMGTGIVATGAFMARDIDVGGAGARIVFQDGFAGCTATTCDDGNPCTVDGCSACGECTHASAPAGTSCSDGDACDGAEACDGAGHCVPGAPVTCAPPDQCHSAGVCDPATGLCLNPPLPNGTPCNDGDLCTQTDTCESGLCTGGNPVVCGTTDQCHDAGICNPATGVCSNPAKPDGTPCSDGDACTQTDVCEGGACSGSEPVVCAVADQCHAAGICDTGTGLCSSGEKEDGTACDDGNEQTQKDSCEGGTCLGRIPCIPVSATGTGANHTCAVRTDGVLWCWGLNDHGQLGDGTTENRQAPVRVPGQGWSSVTGGDGHTCATRTDGTLWCWGWNWAGQLGNETNQDSLALVQVPGSNWVSVDAGAHHTCGIKADGTLWCWGLNWWGQLGQGANSDWSGTPLQVAGQGWKRVRSLWATVCATREDATLWCWGINWNGQLGDGSSGDNMGPVQVGGTEWQAAAPGSYYTCGIKTDGTLWGWGSNGYGQFGNGTYADSPTPVQGMGEGYSIVESGDAQSCSPRADGTLWCWGANGNGELGNGTHDGTAEPVRVRGRDWAGLAVGAYHVCGKRQDGSLWCWGANTSGQLGDATTDDKSLPVQVAGDLCRVVPVCGNGRVEAGETCDDGNYASGDGCSGDCQVEKCFGVVCAGLDQCHEGVCDPATGTCSTPQAPDGTACSDGNACTRTDLCQAGVCVGGNPVVCSAGDQCHDAGICDTATGACSNPTKGDGTACNDGNACTQTDTCQAGTCTGGSPVVCAASDQCHDVGMCDTATGACSNPIQANGTACNDGNACTRTDTCQGGTCTGSNSVICPAPDQCKLAAACDASSGACAYLPKPDGTACNDGNPCTQTDTCHAGTCVGANPVVCTTDNQCRTDGECDPSSGACLYPGKPDGTSCDDGDSTTSADTCQAGACLGIPANPAPVVANLADTLAFIYSGPGASQIGVAAGTIQRDRAAGIRGHVRVRDGSPLAGVKLTIGDHPEFGYATSREDGGYDMVVNGGGSLVVQLTKSGYLKVNRIAVAPWQGFSQVDDAVMIQPDSQVSPINFTQPSMQVAAGSPVSDQDGTRQASVLIPEGTTATMVLANGTQTSVGALNIRITEFTVGAEGPAAMPAPLPPATAYTYALSYTADEAIIAGAKSINFSQPVIHYNENFLNLPVGVAVPSGYYDEDRHTWLPSQNGGVVKILSADNGLARLDVDGSGTPASLAAKQAMGISDSELASLAQRYQPGRTLWRVPLTHFSIYDFNMTGSAPPDAQNPNGEVSDNSTTPNSCTQSGSIIECENQVLGERVPIAGTPFSLNYRSNRVRGYQAENELMLKLSGASVPASLTTIKLEVDVAGRRIEQAFSPAANLSYRFLWDGKDSVGRLVNGRQPAEASIGYQYPVQYTSPPDGVWHAGSSFGQLSTNPDLEMAPGRTDTISWQKFPVNLGTYLAKGAAIGGWTIDVNHTYDPARVLWRGDGEREMPDVPAETSTVALVSTKYVNGPGHWFGVTSDGTIYYMFVSSGYVADLWKIDPRTGASIHIASVTGGYDPRPVAVGPDDSVYYATPGTVHHLSAAGQEIGSWLAPGLPGPGGAQVDSLAVGPDGVVYYFERITDMSYAGANPGHRLMRLDANGQFSAVAGSRTVQAFGGDGGPASAATFSNPASLAVGPDGAIYVGEGTQVYRVRRIGTDGIIKTVAGNGTLPGYPDFVYPHAGDGGPATSAQVNPTGLTVGPDNALYITDRGYYMIHDSSGYWSPDAIRVVKNGIIEHFAGSGVAPTAGSQTEGVPAGQMLLQSASDLAVAPDGSLLVVEGAYSAYLMRISPPLPGAQPGSFRLPSQDGKQVYEFDRTGRHLATGDRMTSALQYQFGYNSAGVLASIADANGLVTTIERDPDTGLATGIVAPNGQRTSLTMGADGYLAAVDQPGGIHHGFSYYAGDRDGLLAAYTNPRGNVSSFSYDNVGRLVGETMRGGSAWALARTGPTPQNPGAGVQVALTSAMGRTRNYNIATTSNGTENRSTRSAAGLVSTSVKTPAGVTSTTSPDGMTTSVTEAVDPIYWMQAPLPGSTVVKTPAGNQMTVNLSRTVAVDANKNLVSQVDTTTVNGKASTSTYNVAANTITSVSPLGRQTVTTLDAQGRVVQVQAGNLAPTAYAYDSRGRLATVTVGTGATARVTSFGYDDLDRLESVTDPLLRVQSYVYDDANRVVSQVFTDGNQVGFSYDANGNVTRVTPPGRPEHDFGYTPADLMSSYTPPVVAGTGATSYEYNLDKQPTVIHRPDGSQIVTTYDSAGRVATVTYPAGPSTSDGNITVTRSYHPTTGNLSGMTASDGQTLAYGYDGNLALSTTWSGTVAGSVSRTYDNNFRVASESVNGANTVARGYDDDGLLTSVDGLTITRDATNGLISDTTLGSVTNHRTYDSFGKTATYEAKFGTTSLYSVTYVRDALGRIETKTETIQGTTTVWGYAYDTAGRLWQVTKDGVLVSVYGYGANGNRLTKTTSGGTETATYDDQDRLLTYGKWAYTYTANGELRTKTDTTIGDVTTYSYDGQGNLRRVSLPDGRVIEYVVDGENRRVGKKVNGTLVRRWLYKDSLKPAAELDGSGAIVARYADGLVIKGANTYKVVADHLGTPRLLVDRTTGAVVQRLDFDEFGQVTSDSSPGFQTFGFAGGIYDADTGLIRFGARDYDPALGRWTAIDPIRFEGKQANLYAYVLSDPVNAVDPTGTDWLSCTVCGICQAVAIGASAACFASQYGAHAPIDCAHVTASFEGGCGAFCAYCGQDLLNNLPQPHAPTGTSTATMMSTGTSTSTGTSLCSPGSGP